ncbi:MAG: MFS transporter [Rhodospirillaceae bacterium]|jgi:MFS transporter, FSR family, fosmidomycin resistance protein|nr:MFS transporter [Rhodospirillaceae bacterium]MBT6136622.1 MFS transporter [Rhodospirillaceae bacterium]
MSVPSSRLPLVFSSIGHTYSHLFMLLYPTVILALEDEWDLAYGKLMLLFLPASILFGVCALPAGWIGDRWSAPKMMVIYFIGTGAASVVTGLVDTPLGIAVGLGLIGVFGSIYHPVGIAWLVRDAGSRGKALGISGFFGGVGVASGPLLAGIFIDLMSWRYAFIIPGIVCCATGFVLWYCVGRGFVRDANAGSVGRAEAGKSEMLRGAIVLAITVIASGLIYQAISNNLPKLFDQRIGHMLGEGTFGVGALAGAIFILSSLAQLLGGWVADRYNLKLVYVVGWAIQVPMLVFVAYLHSLFIWPAVLMIFVASSASLPAENSLFARYSPPQWRATAYGVKFLLALGVSAAAVPLASYIHLETGGFYWMFVVLTVFAVLAVAATLFLPNPGDEDMVPVPEPAE